jgi:uncharacterized protein
MSRINPSRWKNAVNEPKIVFISGASSGIGEAAARYLAARGYRTILGARREDRLRNIADEICQRGGDAKAVYLDVANYDSVKSAIENSISMYGKIDVLVNNAGFGRLRWLDELDPLADIYNLIQVNLVGLIWLAQAVLPGMIAQRSGHIINMASLASFVGMPTYSIYAASKFGVRGFSESLRREVSGWGISVSGLYPGAVDTEFQSIAKVNRKTGMTTPKFLRLQTEDIARAVEGLIRRPRHSVIMPGILRPVLWLNVLFPKFVDRLTYGRFVSRERG